MRSARFAIVLPVLACGLSLILWYTANHEKLPPTDTLEAPTAFKIQVALNAPAALCAAAICVILDVVGGLLFPRLAISDLTFQLVFALCVVGLWFGIGRWIDNRHSTERKSHGLFFGIGEWIVRICVLPMGVFFIVLGFSRGAPWGIRLPGDTIARLLVIGWGMALIGIVAFAMARWFGERKTRI